MRLTYLGHAGFIVEIRELRLLIDPWFYPAFLNSWFPYPNNRFLLPSVLDGKFDFLYISHLHQDHFDHNVLAQLDKSTTVLCPHHRSKGVGKKLASLGFRNLVPLSHKQSRQIANGIRVTMFLDTSHKEDSGLLLEVDGFRFLALNDCNTSLTELPGDIDLVSAQYSGAMWYPNCYEYRPEIMQQKVARVRADLMDTLIRKCNTTQAKAYIPSAGPACYLDPALMHFNDRKSTIFPLWEDVAEHFAVACPDTSVLELQPGDTLDLPGSSVTRCHGSGESMDLARYSDCRSSEWGEFYAGDEPEIDGDEINAYFGRLQRRNDHLMKDLHKYFRVISDDRSWGVHLGEMAEEFVIEGEDPYPPEYVLIVSPRVLRAVLDRRIGWEEALLSLRVRLRRIPDVFDSRFMGLLRYGNEPVQTRQMAWEAGRFEMIEKDGLRLPRFCPHAGEDLTNATICGDVIECPRHHWKWDIRTGTCLEGGSLPLRIASTNQGNEAHPHDTPGRRADFDTPPDEDGKIVKGRTDAGVIGLPAH
jgi:UDP-MurNAc hydroxylase